MFKIAIDEPCNQAWQQMDPQENGRYCANCCKTVVDFSTMAPGEIVKYLGNNSNVCGRLTESQVKLTNIYASPAVRTTGNKYRGWQIAAISFLWTIFALKAFAQDKVPVPQEQTVADKQPHNGSLLKNAADTAQYGIVIGKLTDSLNFPVNAAVIVSLPSGKRTNADINGLFGLVIPIADKQLQINCIGYKPQLISIDKARQEYNITLQEEPHIMGEVSIFPKAVNH